MTHLYNLPEPLEVELITHTKTVTIPSKARWLYIVAYGGAGGGGGGASGAINTQRGGGAGGQAGLMNFAMVPTLMFPQSRLTVYPGAGGAGGGPDTAGSWGLHTYVRLWDAGTIILDIFGGGGGNPGTSTSGGGVQSTGTGINNFGYNFTGDGGQVVYRAGSNGGATGAGSSISFYNSVELGGTGGTGGAGCASGSYTVANGGSIQYLDLATIAGGTGNATAGNNGINGNYAQLPITNYNGLIRAWGGTGGGNSNSGPGGNGGNGGLASGGGGGGGGLTGGSGGNGGNGYAIVCWW